jgi:hypothetical protein
VAVLISGSAGSWVNVANTVFESLRECVPELVEDGVLAQILEDAQNTHLLELEPLSSRQREFIALGLSTLSVRAAERDGVHPDLLTQLETVQAFVLREGVQP